MLQRRGFMLIELLVAIARISVLATLQAPVFQFPVFQSVRENARRISCQSNENQFAFSVPAVRAGFRRDAAANLGCGQCALARSD